MMGNSCSCTLHIKRLKSPFSFPYLQSLSPSTWWWGNMWPALLTSAKSKRKLRSSNMLTKWENLDTFLNPQSEFIHNLKYYLLKILNLRMEINLKLWLSESKVWVISKKITNIKRNSQNRHKNKKRYKKRKRKRYLQMTKGRSKRSKRRSKRRSKKRKRKWKMKMQWKKILRKMNQLYRINNKINKKILYLPKPQTKTASLVMLQGIICSEIQLVQTFLVLDKKKRKVDRNQLLVLLGIKIPHLHHRLKKIPNNTN